jgi:hypothetical protein
MAVTGYEKFKCMQCGGTDLCFGYQGTSSNVFVPSGMFTIHGYKIRAYVCLYCGTVSQYIPMSRMQKLKDKLKSRFE